ncbi:hypothetical protein J2Z31_002650 [Sinorhizobium kostiense]|uniref:Transcriptional regulator n=1 Tax=Sinorhizobium kostiense TaxID=76747 RepID=A0ABS4QZR1_9HYPH|nr:hypothetical protein [Sinorhizobium kostiense]MBP2236136.1 hypothetical protein [Sinorhizobium kostiense]
MKSPWRFLVQLSSRRQPAKVQENSVTNDADPEGLENEAENKSALPSDNPTEASSAPDQDAHGPIDQVSMLSNKPTSDPNLTQAMSSPIDIQEAETPAPSEAQRSGRQRKASVSKSEKGKTPERKPRIERRERSKRARAQVVARSAVATNEAQGVQPSSSGDPFFNEAAILDEEIKELRLRLAQKLYLQNVQLKKMLERFDVS